MATRRKIVLIGAGSAMFTQGLVADLILSRQPWALGLVDIDSLALETAAGLSERMIAAKAADVTVSSATDRREILPGAEVVVTTIGVGGRRAWEADVFIPRKYGIYQPVGDTVMPGGISRAMRMVPALVEIARDVLQLCPEALFFNYSNPMTVNCWAVRKATGTNITGLCHGVPHVIRELSQFVSAPPEEVTALWAGMNHFTWVYDLRRNGRDLWPVAQKRVERANRSGEADDAPFPVSHNPFSWSLFQAYGAYPAVNDRHVAEFFPERFPEGHYYGKTLGVDAFSFEDTIAHGDDIYARMRAQAKGEAPLDERVFQRAAGEHEQLLAILAAISEDKREIYSANLPNQGIVPNLPGEAILEVPCVATARGLLPIHQAEFPDVLAAPLQRKLAAAAVTVEAALSGNRKLFVEALLTDGAVTSPATAEKLADDLLRAQAQYLPQFA